jgi:hypothetical protein
MINTIRSYREQRNSLDRLVDFDLTSIDVKTKSNALGEFILY